MGRREYRFATEALREGRMTRAFTTVVAGACFVAAGLLVAVQFHPARPVGVVAKSVHIVAMVTAVGYGMRWLFGRFPGYRQAVVFVVWADCAAAFGAAALSETDARLCATLYLGIVGIFAAFLLGARILYAHCVFGALVIGSITAWAVAEQHAGLFDLFVFYMPALAWVVAVPLGGLALIEGGRRAIGRTARSARYDPLTGLRNRRGLYAAIEVAVRRLAPSATVVVAVCDIDRFKALNDAHGHVVGDTALIEMAKELRALARPDEITARIGGDELVLVVFGSAGDVSEVVDRLMPLARVDIGALALTASIGVATQVAGDRYFSIDDVLRHADAAMYEAKRSGGATCVIHQPMDRI
ncbi:MULTISPECIES: diguanylate cyclase [unclassified Mycobacterium]|uniref:GGDEF domain-containing protein n=1 Tax=unclassified Mycobacterium TaxID=2642494 RepID=UPI0027428BF0|nr:MULTISPECIES: GGDEF domain-containing protein [unclassified Mycobacterium]MDP7706242.1 GGDEF domain-containing protein [Mycobacterium sp. TY815]MDP7725988.1 GGDEF domain-containing protein [Mycobacterium sp. TY814]